VGIQSEVSAKPLYIGTPYYLDVMRIYESAGFALFGLAEVYRHPELNSIVDMNCVMMRPGARPT
jgi:hypothetical protein